MKSRHARTWRTKVKLSVGSKRPEHPLQRARVLIEMWRHSEADPDNLVRSAKPILDGLQPQSVGTRKGKPYPKIGCGVIVNDKAENFQGGRAIVRQRKCKKAVPEHTIVTVEEA
jgi:hypothetical protein